jgi:hypothetical protein
MGQRDDAFFGAFIVDANLSKVALNASSNNNNNSYNALPEVLSQRRLWGGGSANGGVGYFYDEERFMILSDFYHSYEPYNQLSLTSKPFRYARN